MSLAIEIQGAVGEVLHYPLRFSDLATGRQAKRSEFVAERSPRLIDRAGERLGTGLWRPVHRAPLKRGVAGAFRSDGLR